MEQNTSVTSCLRNFSSTETLCSDNKFQCDTCSTKQEAHVSRLTAPFVMPYIRLKVLFSIPETHAGKAPPHDLGPASETVQIHGADESVHQSVAQGRFPPRAEAVQHGMLVRASIITMNDYISIASFYSNSPVGRRREPRSDVRPRRRRDPLRLRAEPWPLHLDCEILWSLAHLR